ncbi:MULTISPECIES: 50S ribosomal protein L6 [Sporosarcina]|uniref:Large ribosomal subunit protein uL6 n=2 Tax=Sporosarcina newyorkensis TaxID=759851 RepID=A0A1T4YQ22_9BACL|nr:MULTISPECIES: 50S ribosomal protein L6 [Sporosarcina]EGQ24675.1 50S ribosomal protein L6 [Sporosarcina newyorkensis 2681]MBY0221374.1 50S ribosomal protein L6 [Sporosarcina aquimarina]SKB03849.1 large subunit ribosomal protein L6 [Sporosarcina newyorkensis]
MSRIGNRQIEVPENVTVTISADNFATVKGPKGELSRQLDQEITINQEGNVITLTRPSDSKDHRSIHGTTRSVLNNMVVGVSTGFERTLELIGVGYRAQMQGKKLVLNVGYSHPVEFTPEEGVEVEVPANTKIIVRGYNKEHVGALASNIRQVRPPEPYKGKGIRYEGEIVRRKEGKTGK